MSRKNKLKKLCKTYNYYDNRVSKIYFDLFNASDKDTLKILSISKNGGIWYEIPDTPLGIKYQALATQTYNNYIYYKQKKWRKNEQEE